MTDTFNAKVIIKGSIEALTGLHIGGGDKDSGIGEVASVIIDPATAQPIIPGSSLKGKMRSALEFLEDKIKSNGQFHTCDTQECKVCRLFGRPAEKAKDGVNTNTRLIIRDAKLDSKSADKLKSWEKELLYTEIKSENTINRLTSHANPRSIERVPAGAVFNFEMVYNHAFNTEKGLKEDFKSIKACLNYIEDDYLGGNGSRGYGKVKITAKDLEVRCKAYYLSPEEHNSDTCETCKGIAGSLKEILPLENDND